VGAHCQGTAQACGRIHSSMTQPDTVSRSRLVLSHLCGYAGKNLMGLTVKSLSGDLEVGRQSLRRDVLSVARSPLILIRWNRQNNADAVGDLKARGLTCILQTTDNIRCPTFSLELFGDLGVQNNQAI